MQIQIFTIPVISSTEQIEALNKFLRSHTIIDIDKQLISSEQNSYWTFCVRYLAGNYPVAANQTEKVDYKEILAPDVFSRFSLLRGCRKEIAEKNGVPVYVVFTNQELSAIAGLPDISVVYQGDYKYAGKNCRTGGAPFRHYSENCRRWGGKTKRVHNGCSLVM
jgi:hypothetical protein